MIKFQKLGELGVEYKFKPTVDYESALVPIKRKYEYLAPILEEYRVALNGEWVNSTTICFDSVPNIDVAFQTVEDRLENTFHHRYAEYIRSSISDNVYAARTAMATLYKASFISPRYDFNVIMQNDKIRMLVSSLFHYWHYNKEYEIAYQWVDIFSSRSHPNPDNAPRTTRLIKKVSKMFEGREEHSSLVGRFTDVLTAAASGSIDSEKIYITMDFTLEIQCSHHTAVTWGSCYALNKEYPYSAIYMATHPNVAMLFTVDNRGLKTFRSWMYLHPDGFGINNEVWPNNSAATASKRDMLFEQIKGALPHLDQVNHSFNSQGSVSDLPHDIYHQYSAGSNRANHVAYRGSRFIPDLRDFYLFNDVPWMFSGRHGHNPGYVSQRTALNPEEIALMSRLEAALTKFRDSGDFGMSQLAEMIGGLSESQFEVFKASLITHYGEDAVNAALDELNSTSTEDVPTEEPVSDVPTEEPVEDIIVDDSQHSPELESPAFTSFRLGDVPRGFRFTEVPMSEEHRTAIHRLRDISIGFASNQPFVSSLTRDEDLGIDDVGNLGQVPEEFTTLPLDSSPVEEGDPSVETPRHIFDAYFIDEAVEAEEEILTTMEGTNNENV